MHSIKCFNEWGALAVANRVETNIQRKFGSTVPQLKMTVDVDGTMRRILDKSADKTLWNPTKKRLSEAMG